MENRPCYTINTPVEARNGGNAIYAPRRLSERFTERWGPGEKWRTFWTVTALPTGVWLPMGVAPLAGRRTC